MVENPSITEKPKCSECAVGNLVDGKCVDNTDGKEDPDFLKRNILVFYFDSPIRDGGNKFHFQAYLFPGKYIFTLQFTLDIILITKTRNNRLLPEEATVTCSQNDLFFKEWNNYLWQVVCKGNAESDINNYKSIETPKLIKSSTNEVITSEISLNYEIYDVEAGGFNINDVLNWLLLLWIILTKENGWTKNDYSFVINTKDTFEYSGGLEAVY